jgi:hypothetical protein
MLDKKQYLIESLCTVIYILDNDTIEYEWGSITNGNAGIIMRVVLGLTEKEFISKIEPAYKLSASNIPIGEANWKNIIKYAKSLHDNPLENLLQELDNVGLATSDIEHLDYLSELTIHYDAGFETEMVAVDEDEDGNDIFMELYLSGHYLLKDNFIKYLHSWINILSGKTNANQHLIDKLKLQIEDAVKIEDYENAVLLRDELNELLITLTKN